MTNYERYFGTVERTAESLATVTTEDGIEVRRKGDSEPMDESRWLEWLQEECE